MVLNRQLDEADLSDEWQKAYKCARSGSPILFIFLEYRLGYIGMKEY